MCVCVYISVQRVREREKKNRKKRSLDIPGDKQKVKDSSMTRYQ